MDDSEDAAELRRLIEAWPTGGYATGGTAGEAKQAAKEKIRPQADAFCRVFPCGDGTCKETNFRLRWDLVEERYDEVWVFYTVTSVTCRCQG